MAKLGGFVLMKTEMNSQRDIRVLERVCKTKVGGRIVCRIPAHDDQDVDLAATHVGDEILEGFGLIDRVRIDRIGVEDRLANVA